MVAEAGGGKPGLSLHALPPSLAGSNVPAFSSIPDPGFALKKTTGKKEKKKNSNRKKKGKAILLALMLVKLSMTDSESPNVRRLTKK